MEPGFATADLMSLNPSTIIVKEGLDRFRRDLGEVKKLAESIQRYGQIQPIVINRANELICGGRRLAACLLGQMPVKAIYQDVVDPLQMREWELEENLQRKAFTPAEECLAVKEIHEIKKSRHKEEFHRTGHDWTLEDTAAITGKTANSISQDIKLAEVVERFPELKGAKTKTEIKKAAEGLAKVAETLQGLTKHADAIKDKKDIFVLSKADAVEHMTTIPTGSINLLLTDPPYGIDIDKTMISAGGITGGSNTTGFKFADGKEYALHLYSELARESFRFTSSDAHAYIFVGPEHFWDLRAIFMAAGWRVHIKPIIWIKKTSGQCNMPTSWPSSCYEMILYARKDSSRLVKCGQPDWIEFPPLNPSEKNHPTEKPIGLLQQLIQRSCLPGQTLYDPFMGSGSSVHAGVLEKLFATGNDKATEAYAMACARMANV